MDSEKVIWIKTPRCASTSLRNDLKDRCIIPNKVLCIVSEEKESFILSNYRLWINSYKFTVIRNPYSRAVSAFLYLSRLKYFNGMDFIDALRTAPQKDNEAVWIHFTRTQISLIQDLNGNINYNRIVKFERFNEDINKVFGDIKIKPFNIQHTNSATSEGYDYRDYYNSESKKLVEKLFWVDIKLFDYKFDG